MKFVVYFASSLYIVFILCAYVVVTLVLMSTNQGPQGIVMALLFPIVAGVGLKVIGVLVDWSVK